MKRTFQSLLENPRALLPDKFKKVLRTARDRADGVKFGCSLADSLTLPPFFNDGEPQNPLRDYFVAHKAGPGIFKWTHYFDIYHRHLEKFRNRDVRVLEIGVFSGGSLKMWREYLGAKALVYGVDIDPACRVHEDESTAIYIGNQGDRQFWRLFKAKVPQIDVVIDDGSHFPWEQILTFKELFPVLSPGGVYICEDVHGDGNGFASFIHGLADSLNSGHFTQDPDDPARCLSIKANGAQAVVHSVSLYPLVAVVEKRKLRLPELVATKHGNEWR
jgi:SAM-dependent methyltransferase